MAIAPDGTIIKLVEEISPGMSVNKTLMMINGKMPTNTAGCGRTAV